MKYIYSTSQMSKLSLTLYTFSVTGLVAGLFLIIRFSKDGSYHKYFTVHPNLIEQY